MFDQRKNRRFALRLPLQIIRPGLATPLPVETRDVSSGGVSFISDVALLPGEPIEYEITLLENLDTRRPVRLRCLGKILRSHEGSCAATMERYEFVR